MHKHLTTTEICGIDIVMDYRKTKKMLATEKRLGKTLEEAIPEAYERLGTLEAVGAELGIKSNTLYVWCYRMDMTPKRVLSNNS